MPKMLEMSNPDKPELNIQSFVSHPPAENQRDGRWV
jgi:hypothetical protein